MTLVCVIIPGPVESLNKDSHCLPKASLERRIYDIRLRVPIGLMQISKTSKKGGFFSFQEYFESYTREVYLKD